MNEQTIIKIKTSNVLANKWTDKAKSLGVNRSDYLNALLIGRDTLPSAMTSSLSEQFSSSEDCTTRRPTSR